MFTLRAWWIPWPFSTKLDLFTSIEPRCEAFGDLKIALMRENKTYIWPDDLRNSLGIWNTRQKRPVWLAVMLRLILKSSGSLLKLVWLEYLALTIFLWAREIFIYTFIIFIRNRAGTETKDTLKYKMSNALKEMELAKRCDWIEKIFTNDV